MDLVFPMGAKLYSKIFLAISCLVKTKLMIAFSLKILIADARSSLLVHGHSLSYYLKLSHLNPYNFL